MKRLFGVLIVLVLLVIGVGFARGWLALSSPADRGSNKVNVNLTVDGEKMKQDAAAVKEKTTELTGQATPSAGEAGVQASDSN
jgi:hypothetical protein